MTLYDYLPPHEREIRLLRVRTNDLTREAECDLSTHSLDEAVRLGFSALSYTWASCQPTNPSLTSQDGEMRCNRVKMTSDGEREELCSGVEVKITGNLLDFLRYFVLKGHPDFQGYLWIDALCIDQSKKSRKKSPSQSHEPNLRESLESFRMAWGRRSMDGGRHEHDSRASLTSLCHIINCGFSRCNGTQRRSIRTAMASTLAILRKELVPSSMDHPRSGARTRMHRCVRFSHYGMEDTCRSLANACYNALVIASKEVQHKCRHRRELPCPACSHQTCVAGATSTELSLRSHQSTSVHLP